ncbi:MAG: DUF805 domain-containing protein [Robiginitomaculum sp.]
MGKLLFSPSGRINSSEFMTGAIILIILNIILWMIWTIGLSMGFFATLVSLLLVYMWGCLFAKRFHDSDKSGWLYLLIFIAFLILFNVLGNVLTKMMAPDAVKLMNEMKEIIQNIDGAGQEVEMELFNKYGPLMKMIALPYALGSTLAGAILAFGVNAVLKSDSDENRFGIPR